MPIPSLNDQVAINATLPKREIYARWLIGVQGFGETGDYATLPEHYLLAKIAVAYGCPRPEADYVSLPKQYIWSDIYNAISGDTGVHYDWSEKQALGWILGATYGDQSTQQFLSYYIDLPTRIQLALLVELNGGTPPPPQPEIPVFTLEGYTRLWGVTVKEDGNISGEAETDTGKYAVKWWDDTVDYYDSGDTFSKASSGGQKSFEVYPLATIGTELLLNFNGSEQDSSQNEIIFTLSNGASIDGTTFKFGTGALSMGGGNCVSQDSAHPDLGESWTIEFWMYRPTDYQDNRQGILNLAQFDSYTGLNVYYFEADGGLISNNGLAASLSGGTVPIETWKHVAVARTGGVSKMFIDGILVDSDSQPIEAGPYRVNVGNIDTNWGGDSFASDIIIDDLRITKGAALYTENFTPPTAQLLPQETQTVAFGNITGFNVNDNELTQLRGEKLLLNVGGGGIIGGYLGPYGWWSGPYFSPTINQIGKLENNILTSTALDQFYTDLEAGTGWIFVSGNIGIDGDNPTIATEKGYTVFGSVPPSTSLLLNFNGTNGSTSFIDSSPNEFTVTANGGAQISTAESKFGGASGYFDGIDSYASIPYQSSFDLGFDFTIELWAYTLQEQDGGAILSESYSFPEDQLISFAIGFSESETLGESSGSSIFFGKYNGSWSGVTTSQSLPLNEWSHIAVSCQGGVATIYLNGQSIGSGSFTPEINGNTIYVGRRWDENGNINYFNGYIDDLRIINEIALYTENFTPPTAELEVYP